MKIRKMAMLALAAIAVVFSVNEVTITPAMAAAPAFVQVRANEITSGSTNSLAFNSATAAGNTIVVDVLWSNTGSVTLSDNRGNSYASATTRTTWGNNWSSQVFYAKNIAGGSTTVAATFATAINNFAIIYIHEYSGLDKADPVDVTKSATGTASAMSSGAATTTNDNDLLFAAAASTNTVTQAGSGYTTRSTAFGNRTQDRTVTTAGSYTATATQNGNAWVMQLVAFKADSGSGGGDTTSPTVTVTAPAAGTTVSGAVTVTADADDNVGVSGVQFYIDGDATGVEDTAAPYALQWDTRTVANGNHSITARARDAASNTKLSAAVTVNVANTSSGAPAFVQVRANEITSGSTNSLAFNSATGAGNTIVVDVLWSNTGSVTLSDNRGNSYASATTRTTWGSNWSAQVFYAKNIAGGSTTVAATFATAINNFAIIYIHEYSGLDKADPVDVTKSATGTASAMSSGAVTTTNDNDLLFAAGASSNTVTQAGSGYTTRSTAFGNRTQDRTVTTAGSYTATATQNGNAWVMQLVAFKADNGGGGDTTPPSVTVTAPAAGTTVSGAVTVTADADDNAGVSGVQFYIDGDATGVEDTAAPYALQWDTRTVANGNHSITARARDAASNTKLSAAVTVNVANTSSFQNDVLATGFQLPTSIEFLPDGRMLLVELAGRILVLPPPYTQPDATPFLQLTNVGSAGVQQGVYDIALDPNFSSNHYYYAFYTLGSPNRDRLSRFTANAASTGTVAGSELVLYQDPQDANAEHHGGAIVFGNDGKLYFTTGEHFQASVAQSLNNPRGKIHRINSNGTVPTDNPFYDGNGPHVDSIWAYGLRNPYRASYDVPTGRLFVGDVGGNDYSTAVEEVDLGAAGANYGWPNCESDCSAPYTNGIYSYAHNGRDASITGGFVYRGSQFPTSYQGSYFFADYTQNWIRRLTFDPNGNVTGVQNFEPTDGSVDGPYGDIVYLTEGPDGALYYLDLGYSDISGTFGVSKLRRIRYVQGNQAPVAAASANPTSGPAPLTVSFSSAGSVDPEDQPLTYAWTFGDGDTSTAANPTHTYSRAGLFSARLTVSDGVNSTASTPVTISVGNKPAATITSPQDGLFFEAGDVISFAGTGGDTEDGSLPASAFTWNIDFLHEGHVHPGTPIAGVKSGSFTIPTSGHDFSGNTRYRITLKVTDSDGLTDTSTVTVWPRKVNLTFDTAPTGLTLYLDGIAKTTPFVYDTLVGYHHDIEARNQSVGSNNYAFSSWSDSGAQQHTLVVPSSAQTYVATYNVTSPPAAPAFVQIRSTTPQTPQSTVPVAYANAQSTGNTNIVAIGWNSTTSTINSVGDNAGNVYQLAAPIARGGGLSQAIYYAKNIKAAGAGSNSVTVQFSSAVPYPDIRIAEYSGLDRTSPLDATASSSGSSSTATSGNVTTTSAAELFFGAGMTTGAFNGSSSGYTTRIITPTDADIANDRFTTSVGTYSAGATLAGPANWLMQIAAFRAAGQQAG